MRGCSVCADSWLHSQYAQLHPSYKWQSATNWGLPECFHFKMKTHSTTKGTNITPLCCCRWFNLSDINFNGPCFTKIRRYMSALQLWGGGIGNEIMLLMKKKNSVLVLCPAAEAQHVLSMPYSCPWMTAERAAFSSWQQSQNISEYTLTNSLKLLEGNAKVRSAAFHNVGHFATWWHTDKEHRPALVTQ